MKSAKRVLLFTIMLLPISEAVAQTNTAEGPRSAVEQVPNGTVLHVRLRQTISSYGSKEGDLVSAILIQPVMLDGHIMLPLNTELQGTLVKVRRVGVGFGHETAQINLQFETLILPGGKPEPLSARIAAVDNSREVVDDKGVIHGIRATASASKIVSGLAISAASLDPMSQLFGASAALSTFRIPESEIILPVGTELTYTVTAPIAVSKQFPGPTVFLQNEQQQEQFSEMIRPLPYRTMTEKPVTPSDLITVAYVGSEGAIRKAFLAAGWVPSDPLSTESKYGVMRSVIENQGYKEGPVSTLLLDEKAPVAVYSKTLDTFFARHHLRIYSQPATFENQPVFTSTATHDSGIGLNKTAKTVIHLIDEHIDEEQGKVVNDLLLTGCVDSVSYVERPWVPRDAKNATGDTLITDGRIAVLRMNDCATPNLADVAAEDLNNARPKPPLAERIERNTVLYFRDDFFRGNIVYQGYSGTKMVLKMRHKPSADDAVKPKMVNVVGEQYEVVSRPATQMPSGGPKDAGTLEPSFHLPGAAPNYAPKLEFSISGGYSRFANTDFSTQHLIFTLAAPPPLGYVDDVSEVMQMHTGWSIAVKATVNPWKYFSSEFGYTYNKAALTISGKSSVPGIDISSLYADAQIRQFSYNFIAHARPNGKRFRPYAAVGPVFQLIRLTDSKPTKNSILKFTVKDVGLIVDAYNFGSRPPLEGGGIFQLGLQYGAGFKYQVTPRFFVRADFRETLSPQPDWWGKSLGHLETILGPGPLSVVPGPKETGGPLRQQLYSAGFGISF